MNLRAHHLLCKKYFQGKGYSDEFVENYYKVLEQLNSNPKIKVTNSPDILCSKCPHLKNNKCSKKPDSEIKVSKKDTKIINILGLTPNKEINVKKADELVNLNLNKLKELCKNCEWKEYCN
tara:strand:- start:475 stop:837 length:363 start_codon:yes stop_codon:yes gene_type:complete